MIVPTSVSLAQHRKQQHAHQHAVQATQQSAMQQKGSSTQKQMRPTKAVRKAAAGQYEGDGVAEGTVGHGQQRPGRPLAWGPSSAPWRGVSPSEA